MDFKTATDKLVTGTTLTFGAIAEEFGITPNSLSRMRSGTSSTNRLRSPDGWQTVLTKLARREAKAMKRAAVQLERLAVQLEVST